MADHEHSAAAGFTPAELISALPGSYDLQTRVTWLDRYPGANFLPSGREEAGAAFRAIYSSALRSETAAGRLEGVRFAQMMRAPTIEGMSAADRSVKGVAGRQAAFAVQASSDARWLGFAREALPEAKALGDYASAGDLFPIYSYHQGGGQLVRYLNCRRAVDNGNELSSGILGARLNTVRGVSVVVDPYTSIDPGRQMSRHIGEVLAAIPAEELPELLGKALGNEERRLKFWKTQLEEMLPHQTAGAIARTVLGRLAS